MPFLFRVMVLIAVGATSVVQAPTAEAQRSNAEKIFGVIVKELEKHAEDHENRRPSQPGSSNQGVWGNRWNTVSAGPKGSVKVTNNSHQRVRVGFARPGGGGVSFGSVSAHGSYTKTGLPVGTSVSIDGPGPTQQFQITGGSLSLRVEPDGQVMAASSALPPNVMPVLPGEVGAVYVTNRTNQQASISGSGPAQLAGAWFEPIAPFGQWIKSDLSVGTKVTVTSEGRDRTFPVQPGSLRVVIRRDGSINANRDGVTPWQPIPPNGSKQTIFITNLSSANVNAKFFPPWQAGGKLRVVAPQDQIVESNLQTGTRVVLGGSIPPETVTLTAGAPMQLTILPDGRVSTGGSAPLPPGPPSGVGDVKVENRSGGTISVAFGPSVREIRHRSAHTFMGLAPGKVVRISGSGATATFTHAGGNLSVRAMPGGQFGNLPASASVVPDGVAPEVVGHILVANLSSITARLTYQTPDGTPQTATLKKGDSISWTPLAQGTQLTLVAGGRRQQTVIVGRQWTSLVVDSRGKITTKTTTLRHKPSLGDLIVEPESPDVLPSREDSLINPDPPSEDDAPPQLAVNALPAPNAAPLTESIVARFSRKTMSEAEDLVQELAAASTVRLQSLKKSLSTAGLEAGQAQSMIEASKRGDSAGLAKEVGKLSDDQQATLSDTTKTLLATATLRSQLTPLRAKLSSGAATSAIMSHVSDISQQAELLDNKGLAAAMKRIRRDLVIRDTLTRGLETTGVEPRQVALPQGEVNVIYHPWITVDNTYFAPSGLLLMGAADGEVVVSKTLAASALKLPIAGEGSPLPDAKDSTAAPVVRVFNPAKTRSKLSFKVNGKAYSLAADSTQSLPAGPQYIIEFSRGSSGETAKFNISKPAVYAFAAGEDGWKLVKQRLTLKLTVPSNAPAIAYQVDGQPEMLVSGGTAVHRSNGPLRLQFDAGEGSGVKTKWLEASGEAYFAINPSTGYWDLYPGVAPQSAESDGEMLRFERTTMESVRKQAGNTLFEFATDSQGDLLENLR